MAEQQYLTFDYQMARKQKIFEALSEAVYYVFNNEVEGHIAEFGSGTGFSTRTIALAMANFSKLILKNVRPDRIDDVSSGFPSLFMFDSFEGLPTAENDVDLASPYVVSGRWHEGRFADVGKDELIEMCAKFIARENIHAFEGWFSETLPSLAPDTKFAMVHLDCDLYSSTFEVLDHLIVHEHLSDGTLLLFDDWNCNRASPRFGQRKAWSDIVEKHNIEFSDAGDYAILGHKFFVHLPA
jgi:O-methyltransferase